MGLHRQKSDGIRPAAMNLAHPADLRARLLENSREGRLWEAAPGDQVRCFACSRECVLAEGAAGACGVRFNRGGRLLAPWGWVAAAQVEPLEKKPFFHALPGARTLSFGMLGCDMTCSYCQNWSISQAPRDPRAGSPLRSTTAESLIELAGRAGAEVIASTYNEPLITAEWAVEIFRAAKNAGLATAFISNGNATERSLDYLRPFVDLYKVDLKCFDERSYRRWGGDLDAILRGLRSIHARGFWLEVVTPIIPGLNDSAEELGALAGFLAELSPDIPWHATAYHRDYRMTAYRNTVPDDLCRAADLGRSAGLRHVYAGGLAGRVGALEHTRCPACQKILVERFGYATSAVHLDAAGRCPACAHRVPGLWGSTGWPRPVRRRGLPLLEPADCRARDAESVLSDRDGGA